MLCLKIVVHILMLKLFMRLMILLKIFVGLCSMKIYTCIKKHYPTIKKGKKETSSSCKQTLRDLILPNLMIFLLMICMNLMGSRVMQNHKSPSHGNMHEKRRPNKRLIKGLQFTIHIIQIENKLKKLTLKSIKIIRSMIQMIHRRMILL